MQKFFILFLFTFNIVFASNHFPFSGKVTGNKVRVRTNANLDSTIVKKLDQGSLLLVKGEKDDFYAIQPPQDVKLYVYKTYINMADQGLHNVEANRVNIRLQPNTEAPIVGRLVKDQKIFCSLCKESNKWLEILPTDDVYFYISKAYIQKVGDASIFSQMLQKKEEVDKLLNSAFFIAQAECKKSFNEMNPKEAIKQFETIIKGYKSFENHVKQAKEGLSLLQDTYLQKKIAFLEQKTNISSLEKTDVFKNVKSFEKTKTNIKNFARKIELKDNMKKWIPIENEIYQSWVSYHPDKSIDNFYLEQKANSLIVSGRVEKYDQNIKNKPGNYIIKGFEIPKAYLYSTKIDLEEFIGKKITILASPRPNNGFAYPAYFVNCIK